MDARSRAKRGGVAVLYLLDTNACLDFTLARSRALARRVEASYRHGIGISAITLAELRVGSRRPDADPEDERRLDNFVATLTLHPFDAEAAADYGRLANEIGFRRGSYDRLIAAHARSLGLTLVTGNVADFSDVPGLRVKNWTLTE